MSELKKSVEELSQELAIFSEKENGGIEYFDEYDDLIDLNVEAMFWEEKGITDIWSIEPKIRKKIEDIKIMAGKIIKNKIEVNEKSKLPKELLTESAEELANKTIEIATKIIEKLISGEIYYYHLFFDDYCNEYHKKVLELKNYSLRDSLLEKLYEANKIFRLKMNKIIENEKDKKRQKLVDGMTILFTNWIKEKQLKKLRRSDIDLFIFEKKIKIDKNLIRSTYLKNILYGIGKRMF